MSTEQSSLEERNTFTKQIFGRLRKVCCISFTYEGLSCTRKLPFPENYTTVISTSKEKNELRKLNLVADAI